MRILWLLPLLATVADGGIIGPQAVVADLDAVCELHREVGGRVYRCTGTLVEKKHILTAGHCRPRDGSMTAYCAQGKIVRNIVGWAAQRDPDEISRNGLLANPSRSREDVAVLELETPITSVKHLPVASTGAQISNLAREPERCILAGYSQDDLWFPSVESPPPGTRLRATHWQQADPGNLLPSRFTSDVEAVRTHLSTTGPDRFATSGDSGGPLLCPDARGQWHVVGVNVAGDYLSSWRPWRDPTGFSLAVWSTGFAGWLKRAIDGPKRRHVPAPLPASVVAEGVQAPASESIRTISTEDAR